MILPASKQRLIDHTVSLLEASNCINLLITGKFAQAVLHFFKVKVKQKLHRNMFRTVNCIILFVRENRYFLNWMPCFYFQTRPHASSVIFAHGYVRFCDRVNKLQWLSSVLFWSRFGYLYCFLWLIAMDKRNIIHFAQKLFPFVICEASDIFSREGMQLLFISLSPGAKHCTQLTRR